MDRKYTSSVSQYVDQLETNCTVSLTATDILRGKTSFITEVNYRETESLSVDINSTLDGSISLSATVTDFESGVSGTLVPTEDNATSSWNVSNYWDVWPSSLSMGNVTSDTSHSQTNFHIYIYIIIGIIGMVDNGIVIIVILLSKSMRKKVKVY